MFSNRFRRILFFLVGVYGILFAGCFYYEYCYLKPSVRRLSSGDLGAIVSGASPKKNYASAKYSIGPAASLNQIDQKYERTATVQSYSSSYDDDEEKTRELIAAQNGIIQYEHGKGTKGQRVLYLHIGIQPARFDQFYAAAQTIGSVRSMEIVKTDKTNDFLTLKAQRASLEKNRTALLELKKRDGRIEELMALEEKILTTEQQLQQLGVDLGEFDEINAFCTVRFTLAEYGEVPIKKSLLSSGKKAFYTATAFYVGGLSALCLMLVTAFLLLVVIRRFNLLHAVADTLNDKKN